MKNIPENIKSFLIDFNLNNPDFVYLVAFSGGYDSMCLLDALRKICKNKIVAIHLNHNWRGHESDAEEQNCRNFCEKIGVDFYSEKLDGDIAHTETAARDARYDFFKRCSEKFSSNIIFTAHNKNDQVETLIFRMCHGTGINGLQGISQKRDIYYRPIIDIPRCDIEAYCLKNNLKPNNDSSNKDVIHKRNLIRSEILPLMEKVYPKAADSIYSLSLIAKEETQIVKEYIYSLMKNLEKKAGKYSTKEYLSMSDVVQKRVLYELVTPMLPLDYDRERILTLWNFIKKNAVSKSGKTVSITTDCWLYVSEKYFEIIEKKSENINYSVSINKTGEYEYDGNIVNISACNGLSDECSGVFGESVYVDFSSFVDFNFELRNRRDGDIICPKGLDGHQKLKKYLNARKIPNHEKDSIILLACGNEILWVAGIGISEKIKVKAHPTHRISIRKK